MESKYSLDEINNYIGEKNFEKAKEMLKEYLKRILTFENGKYYNVKDKAGLYHD